jgi:hypothetical protein
LCTLGQINLFASDAISTCYITQLPSVARETKRWRDLLPGPRRRGARVRTVEGRGGLAPLCVRGLDRSPLHADLTMLPDLPGSRQSKRHAASRMRASDPVLGSPGVESGSLK